MAAVGIKGLSFIRDGHKYNTVWHQAISINNYMLLQHESELTIYFIYLLNPLTNTNMHVVK